MLLTLSYGLAIICFGLTLLPLGKYEAWWLRAADFPRLQIAAAASIALLGIILLSGKLNLTGLTISVLLVLAIVHHLSAIVPYTPLWTKDMRAAPAGGEGERLSIMVANVLMDNRETDGLFSLIDRHDPDVLLALETDDWWCRRLGNKLSDRPFVISYPLDNTYGMFLASRLELIDSEIRFLLKDEIPSIRGELRLPAGGMISLYALHPEPPSPSEASTTLARDAELITIAKEIAEEGRSAVVMGDLNDVAWSHTSSMFRRISRMLDPRIGRGLYSTFHANYWPLRWPLDHVFATDDFLLEGIERLDAFGSDHFPIVVKLRLAPHKARTQTAKRPDQTDLDEAEEKLERGRTEL